MGTISASSTSAAAPLPVQKPSPLVWLRRLAANYVLRRLVKALFTIWLVASITFFVVRAMPGNAVDILLQELTAAGVSPDDARTQAAALLSIDLNQPVQDQYIQYLGNVLRGDFGYSYKSRGLKVSELIAAVLPWTLFSVGISLMLSFALGCSGYSGGGGGGPVATTTRITVNSSKLASNDPTGFKFTVNVTASVGANGQVELFDGATTLGAAVPVSNGTAMITSAGLAPGTHSIGAHYLGDTYTQASQSGTLNVTVTGQTTFVLSAQPAASNGTPTVSITIN